MQNHSFLINSRNYDYKESISTALTFDSDSNYLFDLSFLSLLSAEGYDANTFLQGQLTCDLRHLSETRMKQGALCNLKGRIKALMDVIEFDGIKMVLPNDLLDETKSNLAKTAVFSKVELKTNESWQIFGFYLQNEAKQQPFDLDLKKTDPVHQLKSNKNVACYCIGAQFYILVVCKEVAPTLIAKFEKQGAFKGSLAWHTLQVQHKRFQIYPQTSGVFLPHRVDLHLTDYLSFDKGCYKGQEIIARTHYRAKIKHQLMAYRVKMNSCLQPGSKLLALQSNQEIGEIIDYSPLDEEHLVMLASLLKEAPEKCKVEQDGTEFTIVLNQLPNE